MERDGYLAIPFFLRLPTAVLYTVENIFVFSPLNSKNPLNLLVRVPVTKVFATTKQVPIFPNLSNGIECALIKSVDELRNEKSGV